MAIAAPTVYLDTGCSMLRRHWAEVIPLQPRHAGTTCPPADRQHPNTDAKDRTDPEEASSPRRPSEPDPPDGDQQTPPKVETATTTEQHDETAVDSPTRDALIDLSPEHFCGSVIYGSSRSAVCRSAARVTPLSGSSRIKIALISARCGPPVRPVFASTVVPPERYNCCCCSLLLAVAVWGHETKKRFPVLRF